MKGRGILLSIIQDQQRGLVERTDQFGRRSLVSPPDIEKHKAAGDSMPFFNSFTKRLAGFGLMK
jgi:hypothetical protein